jgi:cell division transport system permease protein
MRTNFIVESVISGLRRNLTMTVALVLSTAITLAFVGAALLADKEISRFKLDYESKLNVSIFLCTANNAGDGACVARPVIDAKTGKQEVIDGVKVTDATTTTAQETAIKDKLAADPLVASFSYVSEAEQYLRAKKILTPSERSTLREGDLGASYTVKLKDIKDDYGAFVEKYQAVPGVSSTSNANTVIKTLLNIIDGIRLFSILIALVVLIASILLIANTIQVAAQQRRNETSIMRLVGASRWMTELPFLLETAIASLIGAVLAFGGVIAGKTFVLNNIFAHQTDNGVIPDLKMNDLLVASGVSAIGGILVAALTAFLTLRLYVKL